MLLEDFFVKLFKFSIFSIFLSILHIYLVNLAGIP